MYPDFLGIGAQKSATTWLYANLSPHPEIALTPRKEIHYFDALQYPDARSQYRRRYKWQRRARDIARAFVRGKFGDAKWFVRYHFGKPSDTWYASLFRTGHGQISGDITPAYSTLDDETVAGIARLMPQAKIIFLLRNPIDRAFSALKMNVRQRQPGLDHVDGDVAALRDADVETYVRRAHVVARGDYAAILKRWRAHFGDEQVFVGLYDDVCSRPAELLQEILAFLGVRSDSGVIPENICQRVLAGQPHPMPPRFARFLAQEYLPELERLIPLLQEPQRSVVDGWVQRASSLLASSSPGRPVSRGASR